MLKRKEIGGLFANIHPKEETGARDEKERYFFIVYTIQLDL